MHGPGERHRASPADFFAIPENVRNHELVAGELVERATPSGEHGAAQAALVIELGSAFGRGSGGRPPGWWFATEVEIKLGDDIFRPDVAGWRRDSVPQPPRGNPVVVAPHWIAEVLSPSNRRHDLIAKKRSFHVHKIGHYWVVDPELETLAVHRWHEDGYLEILVAERHQVVRAEPFDALELAVGVLFGAAP